MSWLATCLHRLIVNFVNYINPILLLRRRLEERWSTLRLLRFLLLGAVRPAAGLGCLVQVLPNDFLDPSRLAGVHALFVFEVSAHQAGAAHAFIGTDVYSVPGAEGMLEESDGEVVGRGDAVLPFGEVSENDSECSERREAHMKEYLQQNQVP